MCRLRVIDCCVGVGFVVFVDGCSSFVVVRCSLCIVRCCCLVLIVVCWCLMCVLVCCAL